MRELSQIEKELVEILRGSFKKLPDVISTVANMGYKKPDVTAAANKLLRTDLIQRRGSNGDGWVYRLNVKFYNQLYNTALNPVLSSTAFTELAKAGVQQATKESFEKQIKAPKEQTAITEQKQMPAKATETKQLTNHGILPTDTVDTVIWKIMVDGNEYTMGEINLLVETAGFNPRTAEAHMYKLIAKGWFTRTGLGKYKRPHKYTLNKDIPCPNVSTSATTTPPVDTKGDYDGDNGFKGVVKANTNDLNAGVKTGTGMSDICGKGGTFGYKPFPDLLDTPQSTEGSTALVSSSMLPAIKAAGEAEVGLLKAAGTHIGGMQLGNVFASLTNIDSLLTRFSNNAVPETTRYFKSKSVLLGAGERESLNTYSFKELLDIQKALSGMDFEILSDESSIVKTNVSVTIGENTYTKRQAEQLYREVNLHLSNLIRDVHEFLTK
jgi:hypothetical protein